MSKACIAPIASKIPLSNKEKLENLAKQQGTTRSALVNLAIERYLMEFCSSS
jgi:predicted DNA-binding protein